MKQTERRQQILSIIESMPGATGADIFTKLVAQSWLGRTFGEDSLLAVLFGVSLGTIYVHLMNLENEGLIKSVWGQRIGKYRRRHYYRYYSDDGIRIVMMEQV